MSRTVTVIASLDILLGYSKIPIACGMYRFQVIDPRIVDGGDHLECDLLDRILP